MWSGPGGPSRTLGATWDAQPLRISVWKHTLNKACCELLMLLQGGHAPARILGRVQMGVLLLGGGLCRLPNPDLR